MNSTELNDIFDIRKFVFNSRELTKNEFDKDNLDQIQSTLGELGNVYFLINYIVVNSESNIEGARFEALALAINSLNILVSAFHMARQRAGLEVFALLRISLETSCILHHICFDASSYNKYLAGKLLLKDSINHLKKEIDFIGDIWGNLSTIAVHPKSKYYGPVYIDDKQDGFVPTITMECHQRTQNRGQDSFFLKMNMLVAIILLKVIEDAFTENMIDGNINYRIITGTKISIISYSSKLFKYYNDELKTEFNSML